MKQDKLQSKDRFSETDEPKTSPVAAIANPVSDQLLTLVAQQPFFKGMSEHLIRLLADSIMEMRFKPGHWLFQQGEQANRFYLILEGKVRIESEVKELGMVPIRTLGPGDDLGWAWLFPPYRMHFSARAIEPTRAIFFYGTRLREKCEANHELGYQLMKRVAEVVVRNLNATQQRLMEFTHASDLQP
jgi:CRP/FNR family transcriptional regulator, cyclic AMP receptor protein